MVREVAQGLKDARLSLHLQLRYLKAFNLFIPLISARVVTTLVEDAVLQWVRLLILDVEAFRIQTWHIS